MKNNSQADFVQFSQSSSVNFNLFGSVLGKSFQSVFSNPTSKIISSNFTYYVDAIGSYSLSQLQELKVLLTISNLEEVISTYVFQILFSKSTKGSKLALFPK